MTGHRLAAVVGLLLLLTSLVHVPAIGDALNYFDPPKRLLWAVIAVVLAGSWRAPAGRFHRACLIASLALFGWMVLRTVFKAQPTAELEVLATWALPLLLFVLAGGRATGGDLRIVGAFLVAAGVLQAAIMVLQRLGLDPFFSATTSIMDYRPGRMVGTIGYQNQAVDVLALSAAGIFVVTPSLVLRLLALVPTFFIAGLTASRGGLVAFAVALGASLAVPIALRPARSAWKKALAAAGIGCGVCGLLAALLLVPETGGRFREVFSQARQTPAIASRIVMARIGLEMVGDRPWLGWGAGAYAFQYLDRLGDVLPTDKTHETLKNLVFARETHNDVLQFAAEFGMVGVALLSALLGCVVLGVARGGDSRTGVPAAMIFVLAYMVVSSLVAFPWQTGMGGPLAGFLAGWLLPHREESGCGETRAPGGPPPPAWAPIAKAMLVVVSLATMGWFALDAILNTAIPRTLASDSPAAAQRLLPPWAYRYHALVGASYAAQGADLEAEEELNLAARGYRDILLWNNLGHVRARREKWHEACEVYERWARCGLDHRNALLSLSIAYEQVGRVRDAAACLEKRIALWGGPSALDIKRLALLQLRSGDPKRAHETLRVHRRTWVDADPRTVAEIENLAGGIWLVRGDREQAARWFRAALRRNPELESARRNLDGLSIVPAEEQERAGQPGEGHAPAPPP